MLECECFEMSSQRQQEPWNFPGAPQTPCFSNNQPIHPTLKHFKTQPPSPIRLSCSSAQVRSWLCFQVGVGRSSSVRCVSSVRLRSAGVQLSSSLLRFLFQHQLSSDAVAGREPEFRLSSVPVPVVVLAGDFQFSCNAKGSRLKVRGAGPRQVAGPLTCAILVAVIVFFVWRDLFVLGGEFEFSSLSLGWGVQVQFELMWSSKCVRAVRSCRCLHGSCGCFCSANLHVLSHTVWPRKLKAMIAARKAFNPHSKHAGISEIQKPTKHRASRVSNNSAWSFA